jgi:hypothetical protein
MESFDVEAKKEIKDENNQLLDAQKEIKFVDEIRVKKEIKDVLVVQNGLDQIIDQPDISVKNEIQGRSACSKVIH